MFVYDVVPQIAFVKINSPSKNFLKYPLVTAGGKNHTALPTAFVQYIYLRHSVTTHDGQLTTAVSLTDFCGKINELCVCQQR